MWRRRRVSSVARVWMTSSTSGCGIRKNKNKNHDEKLHFQSVARHLQCTNPSNDDDAWRINPEQELPDSCVHTEINVGDCGQFATTKCMQACLCEFRPCPLQLSWSHRGMQRAPSAFFSRRGIGPRATTLWEKSWGFFLTFWATVTAQHAADGDAVCPAHDVHWRAIGWFGMLQTTRKQAGFGFVDFGIVKAHIGTVVLQASGELSPLVVCSCMGFSFVDFSIVKAHTSTVVLPALRNATAGTTEGAPSKTLVLTESGASKSEEQAGAFKESGSWPANMALGPTSQALDLEMGASGLMDRSKSTSLGWPGGSGQLVQTFQRVKPTVRQAAIHNAVKSGPDIATPTQTKSTSLIQGKCCKTLAVCETQCLEPASVRTVTGELAGAPSKTSVLMESGASKSEEQAGEVGPKAALTLEKSSLLTAFNVQSAVPRTDFSEDCDQQINWPGCQNGMTWSLRSNDTGGKILTAQDVHSEQELPEGHTALKQSGRWPSNVAPRPGSGSADWGIGFDERVKAATQVAIGGQMSPDSAIEVNINQFRTGLVQVDQQMDEAADAPAKVELKCLALSVCRTTQIPESMTSTGMKESRRNLSIVVNDEHDIEIQTYSQIWPMRYGSKQGMEEGIENVVIATEEGKDRRQEQRPGRRHRVATGEKLFDYDRGSLSEEIERERPHFQGEYSRYSREKFQKSIQKDFHLSQLREILKKEMERKKRLDEQTTDPDDPYCENKYLSDEEDGSDNPAAYTGVLDELEHQKVQQLLGEDEEVGGGLSNRQLQYQATSLPLKKPREIEKLLPFICKECDAEFAEARKLGQHMEIMHDLKVNYADLMPNMDLINSSLIEDIDAQMMEPMEGFTTKRLLEEDRGERSKKRIMPAEVSDGVPKMQRELLREDRMKKSRSRRNAR
eukprot:jgi/Bigna1/89539/estExt_fgenesh1_pg.C_510073